MADIHEFLNSFQLQYRRTPTLHKVVVSAAIVLSSLTLISLRLGHWDPLEKLAVLQHRAAVLEQQNLELREDIDRLGTTDSIRDIAEEELGLVDPDTVIIENED